MFAKGYLHSKLLSEIVVMKKVKNTLTWTHVICDLQNKEMVGTFYEKELQKKRQMEGL